MLHMTYLDVGFALVVGELKRNCRVAGFECACLEYNIFCRTYVHWIKFNEIQFARLYFSPSYLRWEIISLMMSFSTSRSIRMMGKYSDIGLRSSPQLNVGWSRWATNYQNDVQNGKSSLFPLLLLLLLYNSAFARKTVKMFLAEHDILDRGTCLASFPDDLLRIDIWKTIDKLQILFAYILPSILFKILHW